MIHNIPIKKFLAIALLFAAAYFAGCFIAEAVNGMWPTNGVWQPGRMVTFYRG